MLALIVDENRHRIEEKKDVYNLYVLWYFDTYVFQGYRLSPCGFAIAIDCTPDTYVILPLLFRS